MGPIRAERTEQFRRQSPAFAFQVLQRQEKGTAGVEVTVLLLIYEGILTPTQRDASARAQVRARNKGSLGRYGRSLPTAACWPKGAQAARKGGKNRRTVASST